MQIHLQEVVPDYIEKEKIAGIAGVGAKLIINKGEHLHIVAPSGSGKTSLIHFIYGLRKDYSGTISYDDTELKSFPRKAFLLSGKIK